MKKEDLHKAIDMVFQFTLSMSGKPNKDVKPSRIFYSEDAKEAIVDILYGYMPKTHTEQQNSIEEHLNAASLLTNCLMEFATDPATTDSNVAAEIRQLLSHQTVSQFVEEYAKNYYTPL